MDIDVARARADTLALLWFTTAAPAAIQAVGY